MGRSFKPVMISIPISLSFHSTLGEDVRSVTGYVWRPVGGEHRQGARCTSTADSIQPRAVEGGAIT